MKSEPPKSYKLNGSLNCPTPIKTFVCSMFRLMIKLLQRLQKPGS